MLVLVLVQRVGRVPETMAQRIVRKELELSRLKDASPETEISSNRMLPLVFSGRAFREQRIRLQEGAACPEDPVSRDDQPPGDPQRLSWTRTRETPPRSVPTQL